MSQGNREWVNRVHAAFKAKDLDALVALHDPQCEISPLIAHMETGGSYRGLEGVRRFWDDIHGAFTDWLPVPEDAREFGDTLIVKLHFRGRGTGSGVRIDRPVWQAVKLQDGRAVWWAIFVSETEALEAVGVRP
jgi:ketosteroid isomerase-like protein